MVLASNGHVMDLPKSQLGVDIDNDFEPEYEPIARQEAGAREDPRRRAHGPTSSTSRPTPTARARRSPGIWRLCCKGTKRPIRRLTFNEITQRAVTEALGNSRDLDMNLVQRAAGRVACSTGSWATR